MSTSPRRPATAPPIRRQYDPSRLAHESLVCAYERLIPIACRRLGSHGCRPADRGAAGAPVHPPRPPAAGARA
jgi:hypothetical protein